VQPLRLLELVVARTPELDESVEQVEAHATELEESVNAMCSEMGAAFRFAAQIGDIDVSHAFRHEESPSWQAKRFQKFLECSP